MTQPSNSLLPHVRTDVAEYKRDPSPRSCACWRTSTSSPRERVYARVSGGIYEEMYDGVGGQVLYLPGDGRWATDLAVDAVKQRDFRGLFGTRDYSTVTAIGSLNYRMAHGLTATARAGRFLAKDEGVRFEMKRRFKSGVRGRRLVHLHQRQRHHLARLARLALPRQGHLHGDPARHHGDQGHPRDRPPFAFALDARRRADGPVARRPLRAHRERRAADAHPRRALGAGRHGRRLHPARARLERAALAGLRRRGRARHREEGRQGGMVAHRADRRRDHARLEQPGHPRRSVCERPRELELGQGRRSLRRRAAGGGAGPLGDVRLRRQPAAPVGCRHRGAGGRYGGARRLRGAQVRRRPRAPQRGPGQGRVRARARARTATIRFRRTTPC